MAKELLELALLVSHKGEPPQDNRLGEDRPPGALAPASLLCEGDSSTESDRWKEIRKWTFYRHLSM